MKQKAAALLVLLLVSITVGACARQQPLTPLQNLRMRALQAVNGHSEKALASLLAPGAAHSFEWIHDEATRHWEADFLTLPASGAKGSRLFLVFHAWHSCESDGDHIHPVLQTPGGPVLGAEIAETDPRGFRIASHNLNVTLQVPTQTALISDLITVQRTGRQVRANCLLRLSQSYKVEQITWRAKPLAFQQAGGIVAFTAPKADGFHLLMRYAGVLNHTESDYILPQEATLNSYWYPETARLPATSTVTATVPPGWIAIGQGNLEQKTVLPNGSSRFVYRNRVPVCYQTLDAGAYQTTARQDGGIALSICLLQPDPALAAKCLDTLQQALAFYQARFGPYPYRSYTLVETLGPFEAPLEGYSMATFTPRDLPGAIAHEVSHTWWGGLAPCTYLNSMWNEAFAHYSERLFARSLNPNASPTDRHPHFAWGKRLSELPLDECHDTLDDTQSEIGYVKGAMVLRALEAELGQQTLMKCMRYFLRNHKTGTAAEWPEFEESVDAVTGKDYGWFFRQWLERAGLPALQLTGIQAQPVPGGVEITGQIVQTTPLYRLQVPLSVSLQGGAVASRVVRVEGKTTPFRILASAPPQQITLDPQATLPLATREGTAFAWPASVAAKG